MARRIFGWAVFALLLAFYVYMVIAAIGNLTLLPQMGESLGLTVNLIGWVWLWIGVALPIIAFIVSLLVARGRSGATQLLIFATGLAVAAALQLEIGLVVPAASFFTLA